MESSLPTALLFYLSEEKTFVLRTMRRKTNPSRSSCQGRQLGMLRYALNQRLQVAAALSASLAAQHGVQQQPAASGANNAMAGGGVNNPSVPAGSAARHATANAMVTGNRVRRGAPAAGARFNAAPNVGPSAARLGIHDARRRADERKAAAMAAAAEAEAARAAAEEASRLALLRSRQMRKEHSAKVLAAAAEQQQQRWRHGDRPPTAGARPGIALLQELMRLGEEPSSGGASNAAATGTNAAASPREQEGGKEGEGDRIVAPHVEGCSPLGMPTGASFNSPWLPLGLEPDEPDDVHVNSSSSGTDDDATALLDESEGPCELDCNEQPPVPELTSEEEGNARPAPSRPGSGRP